jgi:ABC-2 type transport system ATP-binding protein
MQPNLNLQEQVISDDPQLAPLIQVVGLTKTYGSFTAVHGIDFEVFPGEIFGLIGPDGAGKTTTFHILGGVMEATGGDIDVLGMVPRKARLAIGYLTQQFSLYLDLSIDENLRYSAGLHQVPEPEFQQRRSKYLKLMGLDQIGSRLGSQLSGGMNPPLGSILSLGESFGMCWQP